MLCYISNQALPQLTRWEESCAHPAAAALKKVLSAVDSGISRRGERQTTEQRADAHGCRVRGKSNVRSRRRGASPGVGNLRLFSPSAVAPCAVLCMTCRFSRTVNLTNQFSYDEHEREWTSRILTVETVKTLQFLSFSFCVRLQSDLLSLFVSIFRQLKYASHHITQWLVAVRGWGKKQKRWQHTETDFSHNWIQTDLFLCLLFLSYSPAATCFIYFRGLLLILYISHIYGEDSNRPAYFCVWFISM